jgi:hypothetical protein
MRKHSHLHYSVTTFDGWWWYPKHKEWFKDPKLGDCSSNRNFCTMREAKRCVRHLLLLGSQDVSLARYELAHESRGQGWQVTQWKYTSIKEINP